MTIRTRIVALAVGVAVAVGLALGLYAARLTRAESARRIAELERTLRDDFDRNARVEVETAVSLLDGVAERAARGELTLDQAKRLGADLLRGLRYGKDGYFWADTVDGVNVVLLGRADEGTNRLDTHDARGFRFVQEFLRKGRAGGGYTDYFFPRQPGGPELPKRAYTLEASRFGWVVGTGNYVDDIDALVQAQRQAAAGALRRAYWVIALGVLATSVLAALVAVYLARSMSRPLDALVKQSARLQAALRGGRLDARADLSVLDAEFRPVGQGMNEMMGAFAKLIEVTETCVTRIAKGDLPPPITERYEGDFARVTAALDRCSASLSAVVSGMEGMTRAQAEGDVDAFMDESRFEGAYREMARGVNENARMHVRNTLDGLAVLGKYGEGDFSPVMRALPGKQAVMNRALDAIRANLMAVAGEVRALAEAAVAGRLSARADAARFQGDWRAMVEGVNHTLDAVVGPLDAAAKSMEQISRGAIPPKITADYPGELTVLKASINTCIDAVTALVTDMETLVDSGIAGQLSARADPARHQGEFRRVVEGVNHTLDALLAPVNEAAHALDQLARRDLRARVTGTFQGDHARITESVNATAAALHDALAQVAQAVEQVSSAAAQIASSSQAVASGASEQASALEETTRSVESVAGMTQQSAANAQQASGLSLAARDAANDGSAAVERLKGAMANIRRSAEGTSEIIKDVSEIAFQTNLLALNAAVEAARAGESGRGFAVVAEEVRSLALRAKEAATRTEELIRRSVEQAADGEAAARAVAGKLAEIVGGVSKVTDIVGEIAAAAKEQATGIAQVNGALGEMDKVTQQNAASAEESSSAASELSGQAEELASMVEGFRLADADARRAAPAPRPSAAARHATSPLARPSAPAASASAGKAAPGDPFPMDDPGLDAF